MRGLSGYASSSELEPSWHPQDQAPTLPRLVQGLGPCCSTRALQVLSGDGGPPAAFSQPLVHSGPPVPRTGPSLSTHLPQQGLLCSGSGGPAAMQIN